MNSYRIGKLIPFLSIVSATALAQNTWKFDAALTHMEGRYKEALAMRDQHGLGLKLHGEYNKQWGISASLQTTHIYSPQPFPQTHQDNWLLSGYVHLPSNFAPGRWTMQIDTHEIHNDAQQGNSDGVRVVAPQITWMASTSPLKLDLSYANSSYRNMPAVHQVGSGIGFGFNDQRNWLQIRGYVINQLERAYALGYTTTRSSEIKLTQFLSEKISPIPTSVSVGIERGKKIYNVDMVSQTVYNLPMLNVGGENVSVNWKLSNDTDFTLHANRTKYIATLPVDHQFKLNTLSAQLKTTW
jgi:hypothetical protein